MTVIPSCPNGLLLYVSEVVLSELHCSHTVDMRTFDLHGLILYVSEGFLSELLCIYNERMGFFYLHGLIFAFHKLTLYAEEDSFFVLL